METHGSMSDLVELLYNTDNKDINYEALRYGFSIGSLHFIYDISISCEVIKGAVIYPVPNTPVWMLGLINLRGSLVPVFDLEKYFDLKDKENNNSQLLMILGKAEKAVAFQLRDYPRLLNNLVKQEHLPRLIPKVEGYTIAAYQQEGLPEKTWLELDKERFFSTLGEKVCI